MVAFFSDLNVLRVVDGFALVGRRTLERVEGGKLNFFLLLRLRISVALMLAAHRVVGVTAPVFFWDYPKFTILLVHVLCFDPLNA